MYVHVRVSLRFVVWRREGNVVVSRTRGRNGEKRRRLDLSGNVQWHYGRGYAGVRSDAISCL